MINFLKSLFVGSSAVDKALDLASEHILDKDKFYELVLRVFEINKEIEIARLNVSTVPWVDALHKMIRPVMWCGVIGIYGYCKINNIVIELDELALLVSGPGVYTMLKGKGR